MSSFMFVATGILILPAAYDVGFPHSTEGGVLDLSRGTAIVLLILYILFLLYKLKTHNFVFETEGLDEEEEGVVIGPLVLALTLLVVTVALSFCSDYLVGSIDDVVLSFSISKTFVGLILVPLVGNVGTPHKSSSNKQRKPLHVSPSDTRKRWILWSLLHSARAFKSPYFRFLSL
jgi:Ca2+:H+ antiporter